MDIIIIVFLIVKSAASRGQRSNSGNVIKMSREKSIPNNTLTRESGVRMRCLCCLLLHFMKLLKRVCHGVDQNIESARTHKCSMLAMTGYSCTNGNNAEIVHHNVKFSVYQIRATLTVF